MTGRGHLAHPVKMAGLLLAIAAASAAAVEAPAWEAWLASVAAAPADSTGPLYPLACVITPAELEPGALRAAVRELNADEVAGREPFMPPLSVWGDALTAARRYRGVAEYDSALAWYDRAAATDTSREGAAVIADEALRTAIALGDSAAIESRLRRLLDQSGPAGQEATAALACRHLLARADSTRLRAFVDRAASATDRPTDPTLCLWIAFARSYLGDWAACLADVRVLLASDPDQATLSASERAWLVATLPDMLVLTGATAEAGHYYARLAASGLDGLATWGRLQQANLALIDGRPADAAAGFASLCDDPANETWREIACRMAKLSERIERIGVEGEPHDDDGHARF